MKKLNIFQLCLLIFSLGINNLCFSQNVGINATGATPNPAAGLDIDFPDKGILIPRMTSNQRDNMSATPTEGLQIYNTTTKCLEMYIGTKWQALGCGCTNAPVAAGTISGTAFTCPGQNALLYSVPAITGATSYTWSYSGTGVSIIGATNLVIAYFSANATSGNLTVAGTNTCGTGTASANYPITINSIATAGNISGTSTVCQGQNNVSYSVPSIANASSYIWSYSGSGATILGSTNSIVINFSANATPGNLTVMGTNSCTNGAVSANYAITVNTTPTVSSTTPGALYGAGGVTLGAAASAGTINWYAASTGGSSLATGTSYTTPTISSTTTYYVDATANGCTTTDRTSVTATIYAVQSFTSIGTTTWNVPTGVTAIDVLVVAGGGGGGNCGAGGGGAGGLIYNTGYAVSGSSYSVTVGDGGAGKTSTCGTGSNGNNSAFGSLIAVGGGAGGGMDGAALPTSGGSGGGASYGDTGANGTTGQGYGGGTGITQGGGGGGGSNGVGNIGPNGIPGPGTQISITGSNVYYAAGGAGYPSGISTAQGGVAFQSSAGSNTGSGGGGNGGNGGSGIVIIRYATH